MKLVKVVLPVGGGQALLEFAAPETLLRKDFNEIVLSGFGSDYASMSTDYLHVRANNASDLVIVCAEWAMTPVSDRSRDEVCQFDRLFQKIADLTAKVDIIYEHVQGASGLRRKLPAPSTTPDPTDESGTDPSSPRRESSRAPTACSENSTKLRRRHSDASDDIQNNREAETGQERVCEQRPESIKIKYNNPRGIPTAVFHVTTAWNNVSCSRYTLCSLANLEVEQCTICDVFEAKQNTELDWLNCSLDLVFSNARRSYTNINCLRGKPHHILLSSFQAEVEELEISDEVEWALSLSAMKRESYARPRFVSSNIQLYVAGKFVGSFESTLDTDQHVATIEKLKPVPAITEPVRTEDSDEEKVKHSDSEEET